LFASGARLPEGLGAIADTQSAGARIVRAIAAGNDTMVGQLARHTLAAARLDTAATQALIDLVPADEGWSEIPGSIASQDTGGTALLRSFAGQPPERIVLGAEEVVVPLKKSRSGSPVITVSIGGKTFDFWLDTGASLTVVSSRTAEAIGLRPLASVVEKGTTSTSRRVESRPAIIPSLLVGDARVENHPAVIVDQGDLELRLFKIFRVVRVDGILGWNFIRKFDVRLDMAAGVARLRLPKPESNGVRNLVWAGYPIVIGASAAGRPLVLGLDTGADRTWFTPDYLTTTGATATKERTRMSGGAGGFERTRVRVLPETDFRLGGVTIAATGLDVSGPEKASRLTRVTALHGTVGSDVLSLGIIRIDAAAGVFAITPRIAVRSQ
jgi:predicted aspartyl protease